MASDRPYILAIPSFTFTTIPTSEIFNLSSKLFNSSLIIFVISDGLISKLFFDRSLPAFSIKISKQSNFNLVLIFKHIIKFLAFYDKRDTTYFYFFI
ncbi:MAG: hypothetical protein LBJ93_03745 [Clostridiales bacterium]|nr:hypothetical protein [Clostridiales bacterium]